MTQTIGNRYTLSEVIGQGGMGTVWRALDQQTNQPVAVKVLKSEAIDLQSDTVARFQREAAALRQLNHPNIVKVLDSFQDNGRYYLVMEYVGGGSLATLLHKQPRLPIERVLQIGLELSDALTRTHHLNIIHRDIKPANVLLAEDGTPRLTDFGTAMTGNENRLTEPGLVIGTFAYLSPETCNGDALDLRADIWSFGVLLYQMLTGEVPFPTELAISALVLAILTQPVKPVHLLRPETPLPLSELISRMLVKDRTQRISSVRQVGAELEAILRGQPLPLLSAGTPPPVALPPIGDTGEIEGVVVPLHNLPSQPTPFIGRENEIRDITTTLQDSNCRLLTLVGAGGIGKTRLALEAAANLLGTFENGVFFINLAPLESPDLMIPTIADALKFVFFGLSDHRQQLLNFLRHKNLLLVLDNIEHLLDGTDLLTAILATAPQIKMLVTSREVLNLQEEWTYRVSGLSVPETTRFTTADSYSGVKLFLESARRIQRQFSLEHHKEHILKILHLVDGMPLGIELATAWLRTLSPEQIAHEIEHNMDFLATSMRNVPERHRSMRAVFEYSWKLLTEAEKQTFRRLAYFRGSFQRDAAQQIAGATLLDLSGLLDKSLLRQSADGRYDIHEVIRQYAVEKLHAAGNEQPEIAARHCAYYLGFVQQRESQLKGGQQKEALESIDLELENIRLAWQTAVDTQSFTLIRHAGETLYLYHSARNWYRESQKLFQYALDRFDVPAPEGEHAIVLGLVLAFFAALQDFAKEPRAMLDRSLALLRANHLEDELKLPLHFAGERAGAAGDFELAVQNLQSSLALSQSKHDRWGMMYSLNALAGLDFRRGNYHQSTEVYRRSLALAEEIDNPLEKAYILGELGNIYWVLAENREALHTYERALEIFQVFGSQTQEGYTTFNMGDAALDLGDLAEAERLYQRAEKLATQTGTVWNLAHALIRQGDVARLRGHSSQARRLYERSLDVLRDAKQEEPSIHALVGIAHLDMVQGDYDKASPQLQTALAAIKKFNMRFPIGEILTAVAAFLTYRGQAEQALEVVGNMLADSTLTRQSVKTAQEMLEELQAQLPAETVHSALERGKALTLDAIGAYLAVD